MRYLVTGALGHIGSRLIRELPGLTNCELILLDSLATQRYPSLFDLPRTGRYRFVEADILDADLKSLCRDADAVIHLAAITDAEGSVDRRRDVEEVNFEGTVRVVGACLETGTALLFPSTTSVYGPQDDVVDEASGQGQLNPQSPYAESKLRAEKHIAMQSGLRFIIARLGTIYGASPGMRFHTAVNKFCWQAVMGEPLTVWRTALHQKRPYLDLKDAVRAVQHVLAHRIFDRQVYNIVTDNHTVNDIVEILSSNIPGTTVRHVDSPIMNQLSYKVSNARFCSKGFQFLGNLEEGIRSTVRLLSHTQSLREWDPSG